MFEVRPQVLVNATGAWIDLTNRALGRETRMIGGTKGAHLVLDNAELMKTLQGEMIYYETADGRVSVALPWLGKALVGSTDIRVDNPDEVRCEDDEIDYILESLRQVLPKLKIDRSQIVSYFSGVRPLRHSEGKATVQVSRDHHCAVLTPSGRSAFPVYSLIGGKWTTFRAFAEQVTDRLLEHLGRTPPHRDRGPGHRRRQETTRRTTRPSATGSAACSNAPAWARTRLAVLLDRYGTRAEQVADVPGRAGRTSRWRIMPGYSRREIEFLLRHEGVVHLDDLLLRRTAIALLGRADQRVARRTRRACGGGQPVVARAGGPGNRADHRDSPRQAPHQDLTMYPAPGTTRSVVVCRRKVSGTGHRAAWSCAVGKEAAHAVWPAKTRLNLARNWHL